MLTAYNELDSATDDDKGESSKCTNISAANATNNDNSCLRCSRRDQTQHLNRTNCLCLISHNNINQAIIHQSQFISRNSMIFRDPGYLSIIRLFYILQINYNCLMFLLENFKVNYIII